jgi:hypothetical protein
MTQEVQEAIVNQGLEEEEVEEMAQSGLLANISKWAEDSNKGAFERFKKR